MKPFEAPQRNVKVKFKLIFISIQLSETQGTLRINISPFILTVFLRPACCKVSEYVQCLIVSATLGYKDH